MDLPDGNLRLMTHGVVYKSDIEKGIKCYVDANSAGGWAQADTDNAENVMSHMGYVITYPGCPVLWCSKLQTEISLSTTEAEYIALIQAMREVIPFMELMKEVSFIFNIHLPNPEVFCKAFVDNQICIAVAESNKFSPITKNIAIKYHHFRRFVQKKIIRTCYIDTREQTADIFTKPLGEALFIYLRRK